VRRAVQPALVFLAMLPSLADAQLLSYVDASTYGRVEGQFDLRLRDSATRVSADVEVDQDGVTRFAPKITSRFKPLSRLDIRTVVQTGDLNAQRTNVSLDTRIAYRPSLRFVDRVETSLRQGRNRSRETFKLSFAGFDTGFDILGGDPLRFGADLRYDRAGGKATMASTLSTDFGLREGLNVYSEMQLDDRVGAGLERSSLETRIVYAVPLRLVKNLEGKLYRAPNGQQQSSLLLRLSDLSGDTFRGGSYRLACEALLREVELAGGAQSRRLGLETRFSGLFVSPIGGQNSLSLVVERGLGGEGLRNATLAYDHEWTPTEHASIALKIKSRRRGDLLDPWMDLNWSARF
jgi:hypothetical protein